MIVCRVVGEREKKLFTTKQIINVTNKMKLCGRLSGRKFPSSWPPTQIQMYIKLFYINTTKSNNQNKSDI